MFNLNVKPMNGKYIKNLVCHKDIPLIANAYCLKTFGQLLQFANRFIMPNNRVYYHTGNGNYKYMRAATLKRRVAAMYEYNSETYKQMFND
jgi:hypothetical protein